MSNDALDVLKAKKSDFEARLARYEKLSTEINLELQKVNSEIREITEGRDFEAYKRAKAQVEKDGAEKDKTYSTAEFFELVAHHREKIELEAVTKVRRGPKKGTKATQAASTLPDFKNEDPIAPATATKGKAPR